MRKCSVGIIGVTGFGSAHLRAVNSLEQKGRVELKAICDINYEKGKEVIEELINRGVRYYRDYKEMLQKEKELDFISIATPHYFHKTMSIDAMQAGYNVLLEKPPAVTIQDVRQIIKSADETGKLCGIDFMNTSVKAFRRLLKIVDQGKLGDIKTISGAGLVKRTNIYYNRTPWAGKLIHNGNYVLDGTINNPLSHLLNNMLFAACAANSDKLNNKATVFAVTAEIYHGHDIEGDDTSCAKIEMSNGIDMYYYASLCYRDNYHIFIVEGSEGTAVWDYANKLEVKINGNIEEYSYDKVDNIETMFENMADVILGNTEELYCPVDKTLNFITASNGAFESSGGIHAISSEHIEVKKVNEEIVTNIVDISNIVNNALSKKKLFSELGVPWAVGGKRFVMDEYREFKMFK